MTELIITEKPSTAKKIAAALANGQPITKKEGTVSYFDVTHANKDIMIVSAVGHLYTIIEAEKKGWTYPIFDIKWEASSKVHKASKFTARYLNVIKKISKQCDEFTIATDYDIEGEVIGHNILKYTCNQPDGHRMKFSTVTKTDLIKAYENKSKTINWGLANAGLTRHELDWYYGINLSRALTSAIKQAGFFKVLSSGRVQGPALKIIVEKEKEIMAFKPVPYWQIQLLGTVNNNDIEAWHCKDKFWKKDEADIVMEKTRGKDGKIGKVEDKEYKQQPPFPFDLTSLQTESYRCFKINPKDTLALAQELYSAGAISYPRTSSQIYPVEIGYQKILQQLSKNPEYKELTEKLLGLPSLKPNNGKKTDPAHPAIFPTGLMPKKMEGRYKKVYDLIVRRFMATFGEPATRSTMNIDIDINTEIFTATGTRTIHKGWHIYYGPYAKFKEIELPAVKEGDFVKTKDIICHAKETEPPRRYTPASIIKELEKRNLGTKATRASIVDTLFQRGYVDGKSIQATDLGMQTVMTLEKYSPKILDEALTKHFEEEMEAIQEGKKKNKEVLDEAEEILTKILADFKTHEKDIGESLKTATIETRTKAETIGSCPQCDDGTLMIKKGKFGKFIACDKYPECKATYKMPTYGNVKSTGKLCESCKHPIVKVLKKRSAQEICINPDCPLKKTDENGNERKTLPETAEQKCPNCGKEMLLRKSFYGEFYGCSGYPRCKTIMNLEGKVTSNNNSDKSKTKKKTTKKKATRKVTTKKKTAEKRTANKKKAPTKRAIKRTAKKDEDNLPSIDDL